MLIRWSMESWTTAIIERSRKVFFSSLFIFWEASDIAETISRREFKIRNLLRPQRRTTMTRMTKQDIAPRLIVYSLTATVVTRNPWQVNIVSSAVRKIEFKLNFTELAEKNFSFELCHQLSHGTLNETSSVVRDNWETHHNAMLRKRRLEDAPMLRLSIRTHGWTTISRYNDEMSKVVRNEVSLFFRRVVSNFISSTLSRLGSHLETRIESPLQSHFSLYYDLLPGFTPLHSLRCSQHS